MLCTVAFGACEPPRAVPPNMPNAEERARATRKQLRAFNAARFEQERHEVDSAAHVHASEAVALPGGMWLSLEEGGEGLSHPVPQAGDRVAWTWVAQGLDGDTLTSGEEDFFVDKDALPLCFHEVAKVHSLAWARPVLDHVNDRLRGVGHSWRSPAIHPTDGALFPTTSIP